MGVTIGAGIYVLIGSAAGRAGMQAPLAFVAAAMLMGLTAASFAWRAHAGRRRRSRLCPRGVPIQALVNRGRSPCDRGRDRRCCCDQCRQRRLHQGFVTLPEPVIIAAVVLSMGAIAAWGIKESVVFAGAMTLIEVGGLVVMVAAGVLFEPDLVTRLPEMLPAHANPAALVGLMGASLLAVFAFIGFEALVNVAEELHAPERTLPRAIFLTLALTALLYALVVSVALVAVPPAELAASKAPLARPPTSPCPCVQLVGLPRPCPCPGATRERPDTKHYNLFPRS